MQSNIAAVVNQDYLWYNSSTGNANSSQESGAYIFRPNGTYPVTKGAPQITVTKGRWVQTAVQIWNQWLTQVVRVYKDSPLIEVTTRVSPIDIRDGLGKEVVSRFSTNIQNQGRWYSDSQGMEMIERVVDKRPNWPAMQFSIQEPESFNYVPMNQAAFIRDQQIQFGVITDRSHGCAGLKEGSIEYMVQRRTLRDDERGVNEPLNETITLYTTSLLSLTSVADAQPLARAASLRFANRPTIAFQKINGPIATWGKGKVLSASGLKAALPGNVHLLNLRTLEDGKVILRLHHIFSSDEPAPLSQPVTLDIANLFQDFSVTQIEEASLTANKLRSSVQRLTWKASEAQPPKYQFSPLRGSLVTLRPMEIRTFILQTKKAL